MNIKKLVASVMAFCVVAGAVPVSAVKFVDNSIVASAEDEYTEGTYESLTYQKYSDHVVIVGCQLTAIKVDIPAKIEGLPITEIGNMAFYYCSSLAEITIPDSVTTIGNSAFADCKNLTDVTIPESVTNIGAGVFRNTPWLENKRKENPLVIVNDILIDGKTCEGEVTIPDNVKTISDYAFYDTRNLTKITIPDSVATIGSSTFEECKNLKDIIIPESVTNIGGNAFRYTPWLESKQKENPLVIVNNIIVDGRACSGNVTIPDSVTTIGMLAFEKCENLTGIIIPDSVKNIDLYAFAKCSALTEITIPNSVTDIKQKTFMSCSNLTKVTISDSVKNISESAFSLCENLEKITILNPDCEIYDNSSTISNYGGTYNGIIYGYEGSTAQKYAKKYGYTFEILENIPEKPAVVLGDANGDGEVNMADVASIVQYIGNKDTYALTEQGALNADCDGQEGITGNDALAIQLLLAQQIDKLPYTE